MTVTAINNDGTVDTTYTGTINLTCTDPACVLPTGAYTFTAGRQRHARLFLHAHAAAELQHARHLDRHRHRHHLHARHDLHRHQQPRHGHHHSARSRSPAR